MFQIRIHGRGGQGVVTAAELLSVAAFDGGRHAKIVPPTSQNQLAIEDDLRGVVGAYAQLPDDELRDLCEQTIRNYDPCISCATHFLTLEVERE